MREEDSALDTIGSLNVHRASVAQHLTSAVVPIFASATNRRTGTVVHRLPVERDDDVSGPQAGLVGLGPAVHPRDDAPWCARAHFLGHFAVSFSTRESDRPAADLPVPDQVVDDLPREIARHGEPDALVAAALAEDPC